MNPRDADSCYELARLMDGQGNLKEAAHYYQLCREYDRKSAAAAFGLGTIYGLMGDYEQAVGALKDAIRLQPRYVDAIYNLAICQEKLKKPRKALQLYQKVLEIAPDHREASSNLAHLRLELGKRV